MVWVLVFFIAVFYAVKWMMQATVWLVVGIIVLMCLLVRGLWRLISEDHHHHIQ